MVNNTVQIPGCEILRQLGTGGMSTVYLALQRSLDRKVAIKVMRRPGEGASTDSLQAEKRFLLEGRMMARLPHRNIVAVYDIVSNDDIAYITMEYLPGGALTNRMRSGISLADAVSVIVQIATALEFAHNHGVVHRDLKPSNIMFRDASTPVLTDFGIARFQDGSATRLTQTGMLVGTPTYMSPEQINGQQVDGRADQYSLGILFYELLAGQAPFRGETPIAVLMAHLTQEPAPLPPEFHAFQDIFDRLLAKNRDDRYPNLEEFSNDLKSRLVSSDTLLMRLQIDPNQTSSEQLRMLGFYTSTPTHGGLRDSLSGSPLASALLAQADAEPAPSPAPVPKPPPKRSLRPWLVAATLVLIALGAWWMFGHNRLSKDERELVALWNSRAVELIDRGQLIAPGPAGKQSALDVLKKVRQKDPGNARATELMGQIDKQLAAKAEAALNEKQLDIAATIDANGLKAMPGAPALTAMKSRIEQTRADARKAAAKQAQQAAANQAERERVAGLLKLAKPEDLSQALSVTAKLLAVDATDNQAQALRKKAYAAFSRQLQDATTIGAFDKLSILLGSHKDEVVGDKDFANLSTQLARWRDKLAAAEQAHAAALRGELVLNATPWAKVESVIDADRKAQALPGDATTPLLIRVAAGTYRVIFRQPISGQTREVSVSVRAKHRTSANASFARPSAKEYFSRAYR